MTISDKKYWFSGAGIPCIWFPRCKNLLMRLSASSPACYQSGVEIIHQLNITCAVTFKLFFFLTTFKIFSKVPPLLSNTCYYRLVFSRLVFPHVKAYKAQGKKKKKAVFYLQGESLKQNSLLHTGSQGRAQSLPSRLHKAEDDLLARRRDKQLRPTAGAQLPPSTPLNRAKHHPASAMGTSPGLTPAGRGEQTADRAASPSLPPPAVIAHRAA